MKPQSYLYLFLSVYCHVVYVTSPIQTRRKGGPARVLALEKQKNLLKPLPPGVAAAEAAAKEAAAAKETLKKKTLKQVPITLEGPLEVSSNHASMPWGVWSSSKHGPQVFSSFIMQIDARRSRNGDEAVGDLL